MGYAHRLRARCSGCAAYCRRRRWLRSGDKETQDRESLRHRRRASIGRNQLQAVKTPLAPALSWREPVDCRSIGVCRAWTTSWLSATEPGTSTTSNSTPSSPPTYTMATVKQGLQIAQGRLHVVHNAGVAAATQWHATNAHHRAYCNVNGRYVACALQIGAPAMIITSTDYRHPVR